jgi:hypothetical protein
METREKKIKSLKKRGKNAAKKRTNGTNFPLLKAAFTRTVLLSDFVLRFGSLFAFSVP